MAEDLRDELAAVRLAFPDDRILLYSKTGSPVIERLVPKATAMALERLVVRGRLGLEGRTVVVRVKGESVSYRRPRQQGRSAFLSALRAALVDVGFASSAGRLFPPIRNVVDNLAGDLRSRRVDPDEIEGPLRVDNGALRLNRGDPLFRSRLVRGLGSIYVFSVLRWPGGGGSSAPTPEEVSQPDSGVAVGAAEAVLPELVALLR